MISRLFCLAIPLLAFVCMADITEPEMAALYNEVATPHKFGMLIEPEPGQMLDNPNVFRVGGKWYMTYIVFDGSGYETHLAESEDLLQWTKKGRILKRGCQGEWDCAQADGGPSLMDVKWGGSNSLSKFDGRYWMTYIGGAKTGYETDPLAIGVAWTDAPEMAKEWIKSDKPILSPSDPDARAFEKKTLYKSFVLEDDTRRAGGRFVMYYNAKAEGVWRESIGMAVSDDMVTWRRVGDGPIIDNGVVGQSAVSGDPMIQKIDDTWVMFYFGCLWKEGVTGGFDTFAASKDLIHWTRWAGDPLVAPGGDYDGEHAHKPWVIKHNGIVYHFYCAVGRSGRGLALATSKPCGKETHRLMTEWGKKVTSGNAWRDYPRPQMVRDNWTCLNGEWDYAITSVTNTSGQPTQWQGKIRVPFAIESTLSGVGKSLEPDQFLWYRRKIQVKKSGEGEDGGGDRILLHFGAVDFRTMVFIGHDEVTDVPHEGGQLPWTLDITDRVRDGENELLVCVWDPTDTFINSRGKQSRNPTGCFYTRVSGIWQTVWMEKVPAKHIRGYKVSTDIDNSTVKFDFDVVGKDDVVVKIDGVSQSGESGESGEVMVKIPDAKLWSPEEPNLYKFTAKYGKDKIRGYFGMRKFEKRKDAKGVWRFFLNDKPYFVLGTLDQGWWPDGLLTPPSEEAMAFDIQTLKSCGYNTMRKHIKVEPLRYYALCDRMGLLVIQDLPSTSVLDDWKSPMKPETVQIYGMQRVEMKGLVDALYNIPSIVMWCPYNEGWGQPGEFLTHSMLDFVRHYDSTRLVNGPSGCWDWEGGHLLPTGWVAPHERVRTEHKPNDVCEAADAVDLHVYRGPDMLPANDRRVSFLGEFGGLGHPVTGHLWRETTENWGYGGSDDTKTREGLAKTYLGLMDKLSVLAKQGLGGAIYTQTTDVEIEINGLMTYDRKVLKLNPDVLRSAHERVVKGGCQ